MINLEYQNDDNSNTTNPLSLVYPHTIGQPLQMDNLSYSFSRQKIRYSGRLNPSKLNRRILRIFSDQSIDPYVP